MIERTSRFFPLWAMFFAIVAYIFPAIFLVFKADIVPLLMLVMFGMGMTLKWDNFKTVLKLPGVIIFGVFLQYLIMPFSAFFIAKSFRLSPQLMAGTVLVGCSPGGTASNVMCYLGNADVALSVMLTTTNTLFAVIATPVFSYLFLHQIVPVPFWDIMKSILQIVLFPVLIGTAVNSLFSKNIDKVRSIFPLISTLAILVIISIIVALNKAMLFNVNIATVLSVILVNGLGYLLGYYIPKVFKYDIKTRRTIAIEVGMQNSGLSVALAIKYFSSVAALPGAIFSVWQNISASLLAGSWRNSDKK
ncbi:MAG TPA: bile acid:sodium symporter family protein [Ignavibacteriaceae bacterium]|nr:bile acid:sodium symporter family protein [Ignavibacteriaceae bacterium]